MRLAALFSFESTSKGTACKTGKECHVPKKKIIFEKNSGSRDRIHCRESPPPTLTKIPPGGTYGKAAGRKQLPSRGLVTEIMIPLHRVVGKFKAFHWQCPAYPLVTSKA